MEGLFTKSGKTLIGKERRELVRLIELKANSPNASPYVGNPDTIYCRLPQALPGSRLKPVCMTNAEWARYPGYGVDLSRVPNFGYLEDQPNIAAPMVGCTPLCR